MEPLSSRQRGIERPVSKRLKLCALRVGGCRLVRDRRSDRLYWGRALRVVGLQVALRAHGFYLGPIDGIYGPMSARALHRFQRRAGLDVEGRVGVSARSRPRCGWHRRPADACCYSVDASPDGLREHPCRCRVTPRAPWRIQWRRAQGLAAWYQGSTSLRKHGPFRKTRRFVANVRAPKERAT